MSGRNSSVNKLLQRIEELLDVLNMISEDLTKVLKELKGASFSVAAPREGSQEIQDARMLFPEDLEEMLEFEETEKYILIKPIGYLGSDNFAKIASIVRESGGEYISAGKESHFRVYKKTED